MIRCMLKLAGLSIAEIARSLPSENREDGHLAAPSVAAVIDGRVRSRRIEERIATLLNVPLHRLWPQWYAEDGSSLKKRKRYTRLSEALARLQEIESDAKREAA